MTELSSRGALKAGETLDARYRIIKTLGAGATSTVYLAEHVQIKRKVAIKVLRSELGGDDGAVDGFMTEVRTAGSLGHPGIVACSDLGHTADHVPYLVLEYLEGALLTDEIYRRGGLPVRRALRIAEQIASALSAAHGAGIFHRDLTSDNVFLVDRPDALDVAKLTGFGGSRWHAAGSSSTVVVSAAGTPEFMAPEQLTSPATADHRADIYALGVILYEMLTARRPFSDDDRRSLLHRIAHEPPPPLMLPDAPPGLEDLITRRLLAKDPARRGASMAEVQHALDELAASQRPGGPRSGEIDAERAPAAPAPGDEPAPAATVEAVALPALPWRRSAALPWLFAALLAGGVGAGMMYVEDQARAAAERAIVTALDGDADKLASLIDAEVRAAQLRADGIATTPMLRAAIETDAATLQDMARSEFGLSLRSARPGEVLELFQLRDGRASSMLRIPETAAPIDPGAPAIHHARIASADGQLSVVVGAPIARQAAGIGGSVAIAMPLELAPVKLRLTEHARSASLVGLGAPLPLVGTAGGPLRIVVPLGADLEAGNVALVVTPASPPELGGSLHLARLACWALGAILLAGFVVNLLRGGKQE